MAGSLKDWFILCARVAAGYPTDGPPAPPMKLNTYVCEQCGELKLWGDFMWKRRRSKRCQQCNRRNEL